MYIKSYGLIFILLVTGFYNYMNGNYDKKKCAISDTARISESINDTRWHVWSLSDIVSEDCILSYDEFVIKIIDSHKPGGTIDVSAYTGINNIDIPYNAVIYNESDILPYGSHMILQSREGGLGSSSFIKEVPALRGINSDIKVAMRWNNTPSSGKIVIIIEMR